MNKHYYVYLLKCSDSSFYCGYTDNIEKRVELHNSGKGAKYTRSHRPVELVYSEAFDTKSDAMKRECEIKKMTRAEKAELTAKNGQCLIGKEHTNE